MSLGFFFALSLVSVFASTVLSQCGQSYYQPQLELRSRVINGNTAVPHSWPWTVWIVHQQNGMASTCGGSLLGMANTPGQSDIVITAAHCVFDEYNRPRDPRGFRVFIGNHDVRSQEVAEVIIGVEKYVWHSSYVPYTNDLAVFKLTAPVRFNNYVQPICLPGQGQIVNDTQNCYATGWGRVNNFNDQTATVLQQVRLPILNDQTCNQAWYGQYDPSTMLCAGFLDGTKSVCNGDSGGPLVCPDNKRWVLFGGVSFGNKGACAAVNKPAVFSRVSNYRGWIENQIVKLHS